MAGPCANVLHLYRVGAHGRYLHNEECCSLLSPTDVWPDSPMGDAPLDVGSSPELLFITLFTSVAIEANISHGANV